MPASTIIHAAVFAAGAAVGAGTALAIARRRQETPSFSTISLPSAELQKRGASALESKGLAGDEVLRYGNPGMYDLLFPQCPFFTIYLC